MKLSVFGEDDLGRIHESTLAVLESYGVAFKECDEAKALFTSNGCTLDGDRVRIPRKLVEDSLKSLPDRNTLAHFVPHLGMSNEIGLRQGESHIGLIGNAYYIYDYAAKKSRNCIEADQADKLLVLDTLPDIEFDCCNLFYSSERDGTKKNAESEPVESSGEFLRAWVRGRAGLDVGKIPMAHPRVTDEQKRLSLLGMAVIEGANIRLLELLEKDDSTMTWCNPISPLQYHPGEATHIIETARSPKKYRMVMISPEVMMGATGPVTIAGTLVQHNCEVLAGMVLAQLAKPGTPVLYGCVSAPMDLRNAEISQGNFETAMVNAAAVQLADMYGLPSRIAPGNTSDNKVSERAAVEAAVGIYMGVAAGGNFITTSLLDSTLMVSYEHLVLVDELIRQIRSVTGGVKTDPESLAVGTIIEHGHPSPDFLQSDHTLEMMNRDIYYSDFTGRIKDSYQDWYERAHLRVSEILRGGSSETKIDPDIESRLLSVEARLKQDNATWRSSKEEWWQIYLRDFSS